AGARPSRAGRHPHDRRPRRSGAAAAPLAGVDRIGDAVAQLGGRVFRPCPSRAVALAPSPLEGAALAARPWPPTAWFAKPVDMTDDLLVIGKHAFRSRLIVGTGK